MTEKKIISKIEKVESFAGMTVNEMLFASNLSEAFYDSLNSDKIVAKLILVNLKLDDKTIVEILDQDISRPKLVQKLDPYKKYSIVICFIFIVGLTLGRVGESYFRFSNLRFIYHVCWISNYVLVFTSFIWGIANSILIKRNKIYNNTEKATWGIVSIIPFLYFVIMMTIGLILY